VSTLRECVGGGRGGEGRDNYLCANYGIILEFHAFASPHVPHADPVPQGGPASNRDHGVGVLHSGS
jgi:hypothetical protein